LEKGGAVGGPVGRDMVCVTGREVISPAGRDIT
jgi:hypothetical protein